MIRVPPEAYARVFKVLSEQQLYPIIVDGQAVNLWATVYEDWDTANNPLTVLDEAIARLVSRLSQASSKHLADSYPEIVRKKDFDDLLRDIGLGLIGFSDIRTDPNSLLSVTSLNQLIHNPRFLPANGLPQMVTGVVLCTGDYYSNAGRITHWRRRRPSFWRGMFNRFCRLKQSQADREEPAR
jgi:hypothetical protein